MVVQANAQAARIAMEVVVQTCQAASMNAAVRKVLLAACSATDSNVRSLAIVSVFRLVHARHALGMSIVRELADPQRRFGLSGHGALKSSAAARSACSSSGPKMKPSVRELKPMARSRARRAFGG